MQLLRNIASGIYQVRPLVIYLSNVLSDWQYLSGVSDKDLSQSCLMMLETKFGTKVWWTEQIM